MRYFVYQYIHQGDVIYVGKTDDIARRVKEHASGQGLEEKFLPYLETSDIYYHECSNEVEMNALERLLIHKYKPMLNVIDVQEGAVTFNLELDWVLYREHLGASNEFDRERMLCQRNILSNETRIMNYLQEVSRLREKMRSLLPFYRWISIHYNEFPQFYEAFFRIPEEAIPQEKSVQIGKFVVPEWYEETKEIGGETWVQLSGEMLQKIFCVAHRPEWIEETMGFIGENECQSILKKVANLRRRNAELRAKKDMLGGK
jgi:predicted GIY-YIG superfamily endonuclease